MPTLKIAAVQYDIQWRKKDSNFNTLESLIEESITDSEPVDLLLLPETFSTGFCVDDPGVRQNSDGGIDVVWMKQLAIKYQCVVAGSVFVASGDRKANRFFWVFADGSVQYYDKRHLFRLGNEGDFVSQGNERKIFEIKGFRILPQVCYDLRFPVWCRNQQDYDVMVNVANWPAIRRNVWDTLLRARAMENQAYVVGVNRFGNDGKGVAHSGGSCVLDFAGETLIAAKDNRQQVISFELNMKSLKEFRESFPVHLDADEFELM